MGLSAYVFVSTVLFVAGVFTMIARRNAIYVLMGAELIINAAALNFVAFWRHRGAEAANLSGPMFVTFIIMLAAAEAAVALGIVLQIYHHFPSIDVSAPQTLSD